MDLQTRFTDQQAAAINQWDCSVSLSAGAGCGKTFVLTQRFLAGLEPKPDSRSPDLHLLAAITFTERAAREMRDRIREACLKRLQNCHQDHVEHWLTVLRGLDAARITTIHSFCASLLRAQAVEAGIDPGFAVLEPALSDTLLRHVVRDTLRTLIETNDPCTADLLVQFGFERTEELIHRLATQAFSTQLSRFADLTPEMLATSWMRLWEREFAPKLIARFRDSASVQDVLNAISEPGTDHPVMLERMAKLRVELAPHAKWTDPVQTLAEIREAARIQGGGTKKNWHSVEQQERIKTKFEKLRGEVDTLLNDLSVNPEDVAAAAENSCRVVRIVDQAISNFSRAKQDQGALDFDDLLLRTRDLLRDHDHVRNRVSAGIRLLMVDEFQDTDPVQAEVVRYLCGSAIQQGRLFIVGDRKQSIYRFRRADPTVFATLSQEMPVQGQLSLSVNFRSQPDILKFVNYVFAGAMQGYERLSPHQNLQQSPPPAVEFLFATSDAEQRSDANPQQRASAADLRSREADWIARRIRTLVDDPTPRIRSDEKGPDGQPRLRRVGLKDIVILFRALSNVQDYEAALRKYGLDYYLVGGRAFFAQQEVFDLLNLCRYLDDCDDQIALVGVLRSPFFNLSDDCLQVLSDACYFRTDSASEPTSGSMSLHDTIFLEPPSFLPEQDRTRIKFAAGILSDLRANKDRIPLSQLLTNAVEKTGYDASLLVEFLGDRKLANLRKLMEMSREFEEGESLTLKDYVIRLQTSVLDETNEEFATTLAESDDVIRLMSIHQSKGLEFPVVFVADIDRKGPPRTTDAVLHADLGALIKQPSQFGLHRGHLALKMHTLSEQEADFDETIRLFYVACTRAADYLILSAGRDDTKPPNSPWMELIAARFDLRSGHPRFDSLLGASPGGTAGPDSVSDVLIHLTPPAARQPETAHERKVPPGQIHRQVSSAEPGEIPQSAERYSRDKADLTFVSVSQLESVDEQLSAKPIHKTTKAPADWDREAVDVDLATTLGTLVHRVLEQVDFRDHTTWPDLLMIAANQLKIADQDAVLTQAGDLLSRFFDSPIPEEISRSKAIHKEIDFLMPWSSITAISGASARREPVIRGVIDLLIETDRGWQILDYKTGEFPVNAPIELLLAPYELQLALYAQAVERGFGVVPSELSLIVFRPQVRRITLNWSDVIRRTIQPRVDRAIQGLKSGRETA